MFRKNHSAIAVFPTDPHTRAHHIRPLIIFIRQRMRSAGPVHTGIKFITISGIYGANRTVILHGLP